MSTSKLIIQMLFSIPFLVLFLGVLIFLPANTIEWLEGWLYIILIVLYVVIVFIYFMINDPATLERRGTVSGGSSKDKIFLMLFGIDFFLLLILPGFDFQYKWSPITFTIETISFFGLNFQYKLSPLLFVIETIGFLGLILSYCIIFLVMRVNSFASKGVSIHEEHQVITTGLYAIVRHPMYVGFGIMSVCIPLALGSLISLIPALVAPVFLAVRIRYEEELLKEELQGYKEYMEKVKYRLIPKIW